MILVIDIGPVQDVAMPKRKNGGILWIRRDKRWITVRNLRALGKSIVAGKPNIPENRPRLNAALDDSFAKKDTLMAQPYELTNREQDVVRLVLEGKSNKAIALALHISESTVEFHLKNVYNKLQVGSRTELILKLGKSTVAGEENVTENSGRANSWRWVMSLRETVSRIGKELRMESVVNGSARSGESAVTFFEAIRICLTKYARFDGQASRPEFWWFALFFVLVSSAATYVSEAFGSITVIALLLPLLAAGTRRLRDSGKSGWWQLFLLAPVGGIIVVGVLWALPPASPSGGQQPD